MTCSKCGEEFDLRPGKPGYANICPACTQSIKDNARKAVERESLRKDLSESIRSTKGLA